MFINKEKPNQTDTRARGGRRTGARALAAFMTFSAMTAELPVFSTNASAQEAATSQRHLPRFGTRPFAPDLATALDAAHAEQIFQAAVTEGTLPNTPAVRDAFMAKVAELRAHPDHATTRNLPEGYETQWINFTGGGVEGRGVNNTVVFDSAATATVIEVDVPDADGRGGHTEYETGIITTVPHGQVTCYNAFDLGSQHIDAPAPVVPPPTPPAPRDLCPNIEGVQTSVPRGRHINRQGECVGENHTGEYLLLGALVIAGIALSRGGHHHHDTPPSDNPHPRDQEPRPRDPGSHVVPSDPW